MTGDVDPRMVNLDLVGKIIRDVALNLRAAHGRVVEHEPARSVLYTLDKLAAAFEAAGKSGQP